MYYNKKAVTRTVRAEGPREYDVDVEEAAMKAKMDRLQFYQLHNISKPPPSNKFFIKKS